MGGCEPSGLLCFGFVLEEVVKDGDALGIKVGGKADFVVVIEGTFVALAPIGCFVVWAFDIKGDNCGMLEVHESWAALLLLNSSAALEVPVIAGCMNEAVNSSLALFGVCGLMGDEACAALLLSWTVVRMNAWLSSWGDSGNSGVVCVLDDSVLNPGRGDDGGLLGDEASLLTVVGLTFVLSARGIGCGSLGVPEANSRIGTRSGSSPGLSITK
jgi:hypothetical protein